MNLKQFLEEIEKWSPDFTPEAMTFFLHLKESVKTNLTDNGKKILKTMVDNETTCLNIFSSKQLGEFLFMAPRSVSGAMRKLITEQYVEKNTGSPVTYSLTDAGRSLGKEIVIDKEKNI